MIGVCLTMSMEKKNPKRVEKSIVGCDRRQEKKSHGTMKCPISNAKTEVIASRRCVIHAVYRNNYAPDVQVFLLCAGCNIDATFSHCAH